MYGSGNIMSGYSRGARAHKLRTSSLALLRQGRGVDIDGSAVA
jgi:hypothetical protein